MNRIRVSDINDHIKLLNDHNEGTGYLVTGTEKALVIDTMNGYEDVNALAKTYTDLPITVVNTHGHPDHIYGNIYFNEVYLNPADYELAEKWFADPEFTSAIKGTGLKPAAFLPVKEGDVFDLGGIQLEVYELAGHTRGGIVLLDRRDRILFTGDSIIEQTWLQLDESLTPAEFYKNLDRLQFLRPEFDSILTGHSRKLEDASLCEAHKQGVLELAEGKTENDVPYKWEGGVCKAHPYGEGWRRIVYNESRL